MAPCLFNIYRHLSPIPCLPGYTSIPASTAACSLSNGSKPRTKVSNTTVTDVIFADDGCSGRSHIRGGPTEPRLTALTLHVLLSGLTSATLKTVVIWLLRTNRQLNSLIEIKVNGKKLAVAEEFCYLGPYVTRDMDTKQKSTAASVALLAASENCESGSPTEKRKLRLEKKITDYNACVLSTCCRDPRSGQSKRSRSPDLRHST